MRIQLLHSYKGAPSDFIRLNAGEHDVAPSLAEYLVTNGHAIALSPTDNLETPAISEPLAVDSTNEVESVADTEETPAPKSKRK